MTPPHDPAAALVEAALQLPADRRAALIDAACGQDAALRLRVESLLADRTQVEPTPPAGNPAQASKTNFGALAPSEQPGDKIGHYKLLQQIGEGGCGVVYMAEQEEPVRRRVALKVIKLGMDTKAVIARFEAERQALAMMDHPNIARVLDAGAADTGRPYFVMELVRGIKITEYCDQNKLDTEKRLELFIQVCQAIQHAHQKGIIHRDIKPSNILVTLHDGVPVPKVIDFGIAKATQGRLTDQTLFTAFEQFIGTPAYMSPEQAEMSGLDVDTRSDIYALGVLLYELLTGDTPFSGKELLASGLEKLRRTIREKDPDHPSTRLSGMIGDDLTTVARHRHCEPRHLIHLLRGDLDWIVMKALEKDRTRRYESASAFAADIQRHIGNEPVVARPQSRIYRLKKLARRNRLAVFASLAVLAALAAGFAVSTTLFVRERAARKRADDAERVEAKLRAQAEAGRDRAVVGEKIAKSGFLLSQGNYEEAEEVINETPPLPISAAIYNALAVIHAQRREWSASATNYAKVVSLLPTDHLAYHFLAALLVRDGDMEAYRRHRERILAQFGSTTNPIVAERMSKDCLIFEPPASELPAIEKMANVAIAAGPSHTYWRYFQFAKGLVEYRLSRYTSAAEWFKNVAPEPGDPSRTAEALAMLACSQSRLGQTAEAVASLAKAVAVVERSSPNPAKDSAGDLWNDWIIVNVLVREAKSLVEPPAAR
jgi:serine/threonine protein kinase